MTGSTECRQSLICVTGIRVLYRLYCMYNRTFCLVKQRVAETCYFGKVGRRPEEEQDQLCTLGQFRLIPEIQFLVWDLKRG